MGGRPLRASLVLLAIAVARSQFGTIQVDWEAEAAGTMAPHLVGVDRHERFDEAGRRMADFDIPDPEQTEEEAYEDAWWRGGYGDDTEKEWFAASTVPRYERPASVAFSVGQIYEHATSGAHGVVVGWDAHTRAPRSWTKLNAGQLGATLARLHAPHYSVLEEIEVDGRMQFMSRYIVAHCTEQGDLGPSCLQIESEPLRHADVDKYFARFEDSRYVPNEALSALYPHG